MKEILNQINPIVTAESVRGIERHGPFSSSHEAYAILKEEIEETADELKYIDEYLNAAWTTIKRNLPADSQIKKIKDRAIFLAAEAIQVAAMCYKFEAFLQDKKGEKKDESKTTASE